VSSSSSSRFHQRTNDPKSRRRSRSNPDKRRPMLYTQILSKLRAEIVKGRFAPGQRLPTHVVLERRFRSTPPTISKALGVLRRDGFIRTRGRHGTFVAENPPHRFHYALAFANPDTPELSQFVKAIRNEAGRFNDDGRHFSIFHDIGMHPQAPDYLRLLELVQSHRLAGLIFAQPPFGPGRDPRPRRLVRLRRLHGPRARTPGPALVPARCRH
jgi:DNA-binding transcriptional regulator YhcF (GntR family)